MIAEVVPLRRLPPSLPSSFSYRIPSDLKKNIAQGSIVRVPFRNSAIYGIVVRLSSKKAVRAKKLKEVISLVPAPPLLPHQHALARMLAHTNNAHLSLGYKTIVPPPSKMSPKQAPRMAIPARRLGIAHPSLPRANKAPNLFFYGSFQERNALLFQLFKKTNRGESLLVVVPEITDISSFFFPTKTTATIIHSRLTKTELWDAYCRVANGKSKLVIGTRRALFFPFQKLSAIMVDAEHSEHYKSAEQKPHYHARDIARFLSKQYSCPLIFASYAPSFTSWQAAEQGKYHFLKKPPSVLPSVSIIDMEQEMRKEHFSPFSDELQEEIRLSLARKQSVFIFHNRKGYATLISCADCGHSFTCASCGRSLVGYKTNPRDPAPSLLACHTCNVQEEIPPFCPSCSSPRIRFKGKGTQRIAELLAKEYPKIPIIRIEKRKKPLSPFPSPFLAVGTAYALPYIPWDQVGTAAVVNIDPLIVLPEAGATERVHALLLKIRTLLATYTPKSRFLIQTFSPSHPVFLSAAGKEEHAFYNYSRAQNIPLNT